MTTAAAHRSFDWGRFSLYAGPALTMFDRYAVTPLLIPIALDFGRPLGQAALAATVYYIAYGVAQPAIGVLSDRFGRIRVMRMAFWGMALFSLLSAVAPSFQFLVSFRFLTGLCTAAILPTCIVYVGDTVPFRNRQRALADLQLAVAVGTALSSLLAGLIGGYAGWRWVYLIPAPAALGMAVMIGRLPETLDPALRSGAAQSFRRVLSRPWALAVIGLVLIEGMSLMGCYTYLAPALEAHGLVPALAGAVVAGYGLSVLFSTRIVKPLSVVLSGSWLIAIGGLADLAGFAIAARSQTVPAILGCAILCGVAYVFMHGTFQTWITDVAPDARGTAASMFVAAALIGASIATAALAPLAGAGRYDLVFGAGALLIVPALILGILGRRRYPGHSPSEVLA